MKKLLGLLVLSAVLLSGCGRGQEPLTTSHFAVQRAEMEISLDAPAGPILEALGAPFGYSESRSNVYPGVEKTYRFSGMNLRTYPGEDGERILGLLITDGNTCTEEGIAIGDTVEQVRACYGEGAVSGNSCVISRSRETLTLLLKNNIVTAIQYTMA